MQRFTTTRIEKIDPCKLDVYSRVSIAFTVESILRVDVIDDGLGGVRLVEEPVEEPYVKDYDAYEDGPPTKWPEQFDIGNWGFFLAMDGDQPIGAAAVAWNTNGVNMLEGRRDLSVLWDIRVNLDCRGRGVGRMLIGHAAQWSRERGCKMMKIETQNVNVAACHFYRSMGCALGDIRRFAYADQPHVAHEIQLNWYLPL